MQTIATARTAKEISFFKIPGAYAFVKTIKQSKPGR